MAALTGETISKAETGTNSGLSSFMLFNDWNHYVSLHTDHAIRILMFGDSRIVVLHLSFTLRLAGSLAFLLGPVGPLNLIRNSFGIAFGKLDRHLAFIVA